MAPGPGFQSPYESVSAAGFADCRTRKMPTALTITSEVAFLRVTNVLARTVQRILHFTAGIIFGALAVAACLKLAGRP
jgi:hypothetical protein